MQDVYSLVSIPQFFEIKHVRFTFIIQIISGIEKERESKNIFQKSIKIWYKCVYDINKYDDMFVKTTLSHISDSYDGFWSHKNLRLIAL